MSANESMKETLEHFRQQRTAKLSEVRQIEAIINQIEKELGEQQTDFSVEGMTVELAENPGRSSSSASGGARTGVVSDEFFRLSQPEAARRYLKKIGHAMALDDILDALTKGGCAVGGSDPKKVLYISVVRDTRNFVKLPNGMIGLREFYPDRKLKSEKKEKTVKKRARKKNKSQAAKKEAKAETDVAA